MLGTSEGVYRLRKTGDLVKALFKSANGSPLTVQLAVAASNQGMLSAWVYINTLNSSY